MNLPAEHASPSALIADDERLLREQLQARLRESWPELRIAGVARDGLEAVRMADDLRPDVVFLDIRMPGLNGIDAAREIVDLEHWRGEIVFVTAYDDYALTAFEQGAVDYLLKPVERARLDKTVSRLRDRLAALRPLADDRHDLLFTTLQQLRQHLRANDSKPVLKWLQCSAGLTTRLVAVEDVLFFRSDEKYTRVQMAGEAALIRTPLRELAGQLDEQQFWQIHRSTIVNLKAIASVQRDETGRQRVLLRQHPEVLEVSRSFSHLFKQQ
jgi:DNA-binding LytR/AlgR family response regulator